MADDLRIKGIERNPTTGAPCVALVNILVRAQHRKSPYFKRMLAVHAQRCVWCEQIAIDVGLELMR